MKDLICLIVFLYSLNLILKEDSLISMYIVGIITTIYVIKYLRVNTKLTKIRKKYHKTINKALIKQKEHFIDILTHDLKVPTLAQLRGLELLKNEVLGNVNLEQKELIQNIETSCENIINMISMLQNTYKIENGNNKLYYETFNISNLLVDCLNKITNIINEKNISFAYFTSEPNMFINADKECIKNVILNLIIFAISYSCQNSKILIYISRENNNLKFLLKTTGVYLSDEFCNNIFEPEKLNHQNYTVIGQKISLHLCKKIIDEHEGKIYAKSDTNSSLSLVFLIPYKKNNEINKIISKVH